MLHRPQRYSIFLAHTRWIFVIGRESKKAHRFYFPWAAPFLRSPSFSMLPGCFRCSAICFFFVMLHVKRREILSLRSHKD